ncbi:uncharacterized protein LOC134769662 [Penaeus indicus]|uniref:uncharacterized protein LOC134769662 n=1 Tax=Penaeus indicus TaxID=29960 RepID=UPI00300C27D2
MRRFIILSVIASSLFLHGGARIASPSKLSSVPTPDLSSFPLPDLSSLPSPDLSSLPSPDLPSLSLPDLIDLPSPTLPPLKFPNLPPLTLPGLPTLFFADLPLDDLPEIDANTWIMKDTGAGALAGPLGGLLIGGLIAINVGAIAGYIVDKSGVISRKERQAEPVSQLAETESYILSAVSQVDTHGCILKLLCLLESEETLTKEERLFVNFLSNKMPLFSQEANATALISEEQDSDRPHSEEECNTLFSNCPVGGQLLRRLLGVVWGFGFTSL